MRSGPAASTTPRSRPRPRRSGWALPYYALAVLGFTGGLLALARGLAGGGWVSAPAAVVFALGAFAVAIEGLVPSNAYFIASSALFLLGGAGVARALSRVPDGRLAVRSV